jgi:hypothetical protein
MSDASYRVTRDVTPTECPWLERVICRNERVFIYTGHTYGCVGPGGVAVVKQPGSDEPFFELPRNALERMPS